jgi:hypothetical protein
MWKRRQTKDASMAIWNKKDLQQLKMYGSTLTKEKFWLLGYTIIVFSPDSHTTRSWGNIGSGGESSSMLTSVEGNAV